MLLLVSLFVLKGGFTAKAITQEEINQVRLDAMSGLDMSEHIGEPLGNFRLTGYCSCSICNGRWAGMPTRLGTRLTENLTVAVDKRVIPLGAYLWIHIRGQGWRLYQAQDTGSAVNGNHIDVYVGNNHNNCILPEYNVVTEVRAFIP